MKLQPFLWIPVTEPHNRVAQWQDRIETVLEQRLPPESREPVKLHRAMRYASLNGGKHFRPLLVYSAGKALGIPEDELDPVAAAVELIHAYSLIHDDLPAMDDDDLRRGRPTCHRAFDEATAILAGDALQALAFDILASELLAASPNSLLVIHTIAHACGSIGMAGGQAVDLGAVGRKISEQELTTMHRLKTGALIRASVTCPGLLAGADAGTLEHMSAYGESIGLAFQVHDDILDVTGNSALTGKSTLADISLNKPTFPSILGLDKSRERAAALRDEAIFHLQHIDGDTENLVWLANYVISRDR
jgi:farnesyl diphosphate synthase/geranylgeranyl diphosphate synthase type II